MSFRSIITNQGFTERHAEFKKYGVRRECRACGHTEHRKHQSFAVTRGLERAELASNDLAPKATLLFRKRAAARSKARRDKIVQTGELYCAACGSTDWVEVPDTDG